MLPRKWIVSVLLVSLGTWVLAAGALLAQLPAKSLVDRVQDTGTQRMVVAAADDTDKDNDRGRAGDNKAPDPPPWDPPPIDSDPKAKSS